MNQTLEAPTTSPLVDRWQRQIGRRRRLGITGPRPLVAFNVVVRGTGARLVPVDGISFQVLYDSDDEWIRFGMYGARRIPWGVAYGGVESHRLERNAALEPLHWATEDRFDSSDPWLLQQALQMDRRIERHARRADPVERDRPVLPWLWAAFPADVAEGIEGDGPEFVGRVHETGRTPDQLLAETCRLHDGHVLLPLAWVSHYWESTVEVFADVERLPRRQLFQLGDPSESLVGFRGACQFDFVSSRFAAREAQPVAG